MKEQSRDRLALTVTYMNMWYDRENLLRVLPPTTPPPSRRLFIPAVIPYGGPAHRLGPRHLQACYLGVYVISECTRYTKSGRGQRPTNAVYNT